MYVVKSLSDAQVSDVQGRPVYQLVEGKEYVLYDSEMEAGARDGAVEPMHKLDEVLPRYQGQPLTSERILVPFIGGQGDAIVVASCLKALKEQYPNCAIDVSCPSAHHSLFRMVSADIRPTAYPTAASELEHYSLYTSLEELGEAVKREGRSNFEIFGQCLCTPNIEAAGKINLPAEVLRRWDIGSADYLRIGIALTNSNHMRAYPIEQVLKLTQSLLQQEAAVFFYGLGREINHQLPHSPPVLCNLVDKTTDVEALAALISQMDAMVCPDSFSMHLSGALCIPTLAIFTSSDPSVAGGYPTVQPVTANVPCCPCGAAADKCPQGHNECLVPLHADMHPERFSEQVLQLARTTREAFA